MLAHTVRERHKMRLKIRAASSEGRMSAYILTGRADRAASSSSTSPSRTTTATCSTRRFIQIGLGVLGGLLVVGNLVMRRMIDMRI